MIYAEITTDCTQIMIFSASSPKPCPKDSPLRPYIFCVVRVTSFLLIFPLNSLET